jgi:uncharacterized repeat protein (TIGR03803 family)
VVDGTQDAAHRRGGFLRSAFPLIWLNDRRVGRTSLFGAGARFVTPRRSWHHEETTMTRPARFMRCGALAAALIAAAAVPVPAAAQEADGLYTQLYAFTPAEASFAHGRLLALSGGRLLGTGYVGGEFGRGSIFELKQATNEFTVLHSFAGGAGDGANPRAGVVAGPDGKLWGTTEFGGKGDHGTIYKLAHDGRMTIVHRFGKDVGGGRGPIGALTLASDGLLYGTTSQGGPGNRGMVFRIEADQSITTLWAFAGAGAPTYSVGRLLEASDGLLYGTTNYGGASDSGTVFSLAKDGSAQRVLHSFDSSDGYAPAGGVIEASDGHLYGTTRQGGPDGFGVIYRIDRDGSNFAVIHSFAGAPADGNFPAGELLENSPGVFIGTTQSGGNKNLGMVFQFLADGDMTILHSFTGAPTQRGYVDGSNPNTGVTPLWNGVVVGVTGRGGPDDAGTIFKLKVR